MPVVAAVRRHPLLFIGLLAAVLRAAFVLITQPDPLNGVDSVEYDGIARALIAGNGITTDVGFVRPPLYPVYLALCYAVGGIGILQGTQIALGALTVVLIGVLGRGLFSDERAAWAAALMAAVYPWFFQFVGTVASETLFTLLAVASFVAILKASKARSYGAALGAGALLGIASLVRSNLLVLVPGIAVWWWWRWRWDRQYWAAAVFGVGIVVALLPFTTYNAVAGRGLVIGSSGGGLNFYIGNNPDTTRFYSGQLTDEEWRTLSRAVVMGPEALGFAGCDPAAGQGVCIGSVPIAQADAFWYAAGIRYIRSDPGAWALTEVRKLIHYWRPWVEPRVYSISMVVLSGVSFTVLTLLAVVGIRRMDRRSSVFVLSIAVGSMVAAVIWNVQLRYRFALLDPVLISAAGQPAAVAIEKIWSCVRATGVVPTSPSSQ